MRMRPARPRSTQQARADALARTPLPKAGLTRVNHKPEDFAGHSEGAGKAAVA